MFIKVILFFVNFVLHKLVCGGGGGEMRYQGLFKSGTGDLSLKFKTNQSRSKQTDLNFPKAHGFANLVLALLQIFL